MTRTNFKLPFALVLLGAFTVVEIGPSFEVPAAHAAKKKKKSTEMLVHIPWTGDASDMVSACDCRPSFVCCLLLVAFDSAASIDHAVFCCLCLQDG